MIRDLAKKLMTLANFADWVIIELTFLRGTFKPDAAIVKAHSSMALLRVSTSEAEILVKLIRPHREAKAALGTRIQSSNKIWRVFTASEVSEFATEVGDKNRIHQLNPPIVPALLILETICATFPTNSIKLKFKKFITAGEPLTLSGFGERFEIISAGVRKAIVELL